MNGVRPASVRSVTRMMWSDVPSAMIVLNWPTGSLNSASSSDFDARLPLVVQS